MDRQFMTLGFYAGFDQFFKPTYDILNYEKEKVFGDTKLIKKLLSDKVMKSENDLENLALYLQEQQVLHPSGHLIAGIVFDRALREKVLIEIPVREDEKRFALAWSTVHKLETVKGGLKRTVKLPIGVFDAGTPLRTIILGLIPAFPQFDIELALQEGVNKMLVMRREQQLKDAAPSA